MMKLTRKRFLAIPVVCVLAVMLVPALCYALFILFNHTAIYCSSKAKLTGLLKLDFADVEITEIQYKVSKGFLDNYTSIYVFLKEAGEWESKDFYTDCEDWYDQEPEYILSARIAELKKLGIELQQIQKHGVYFGQIRVGYGMAEYSIEWYQIDDTYDGESNIVLIAGIPRKVLINVDKILKEK